MTDMSKAMEFEGNTVEAAIKKAVKALNVPRETLNIKLVCEEQRGLFGMAGVKAAKIKVTLKTKKA
jgi:predicted RNA-binding protein Jag